MRTILQTERGRIDALLGFVIVAVALGFAIYEFWIKEHAIQPEITQSREKTVIDRVKDKVNDAMDKEMSRIPSDEPTQPPGQQDNK
jgi:hypothetical protein